jgi:hypothetical protein
LGCIFVLVIGSCALDGCGWSLVIGQGGPIVLAG